jgi:uncharacterized OB-fold protein
MPTPSKYWREIPQRYRLEAKKCKKCGLVLFPPRLICPECKNRKFEDTRLAEKGKIFTYTIICVPPHQFVDQAPFAVGIVELDDGVKLTGQIVDCDFKERSARESRSSSERFMMRERLVSSAMGTSLFRNSVKKGPDPFL